MNPLITAVIFTAAILGAVWLGFYLKGKRQRAEDKQTAEVIQDKVETKEKEISEAVKKESNAELAADLRKYFGKKKKPQ